MHAIEQVAFRPLMLGFTDQASMFVQSWVGFESTEQGRGFYINRNYDPSFYTVLLLLQHKFETILPEIHGPKSCVQNAGQYQDA